MEGLTARWEGGRDLKRDWSIMTQSVSWLMAAWWWLCFMPRGRQGHREKGCYWCTFVVWSISCPKQIIFLLVLLKGVNYCRRVGKKMCRYIDFTLQIITHGTKQLWKLQDHRNQDKNSIYEKGTCIMFMEKKRVVFLSDAVVKRTRAKETARFRRLFSQECIMNYLQMRDLTHLSPDTHSLMSKK